MKDTQIKNGRAHARPQEHLEAAIAQQNRREFDRLRSARLFRYLRTREPDARAGYSIHLYRLSAADVEAARFGGLK